MECLDPPNEKLQDACTKERFYAYDFADWQRFDSAINVVSEDSTPESNCVRTRCAVEVLEARARDRRSPSSLRS